MKPPEVIYLQFHGEDGSIPTDDENITWCRDQIYKHDFKYQLVEKKERKE